MKYERKGQSTFTINYWVHMYRKNTNYYRTNSFNTIFKLKKVNVEQISKKQIFYFLIGERWLLYFFVIHFLILIKHCSELCIWKQWCTILLHPSLTPDNFCSKAKIWMPVFKRKWWVNYIYHFNLLTFFLALKQHMTCLYPSNGPDFIYYNSPANMCSYYFIKLFSYNCNSKWST